MIKTTIEVIRNVVREHEDVHVSFGVFETLNTLAEASVREYRLLECLRLQKTSFKPSFDD
jgi:hypothetical protein